MTLKVSANLGKALDHLRTFAAEQLKEPSSPVVLVNVNDEQLGKLTADYATTLVDGTERGVTMGDLEAVGNFHRDLHSATKVINSEAGVPYLEANKEADSFKTTFALPEVAGHGLSITTAVYRPGKEEEANNSYSSVTRTWNSSEDDKFIDEHLAGLAAKLKGGKGKK